MVKTKCPLFEEMTMDRNNDDGTPKTPKASKSWIPEGKTPEDFAKALDDDLEKACSPDPDSDFSPDPDDPTIIGLTVLD